MSVKVKKMNKFKIVSPISTKNSDSIELVSMSLKNLNYDVYFFLNTNELFHMDKKDLDIISKDPAKVEVNDIRVFSLNDYLS